MSEIRHIIELKLKRLMIDRDKFIRVKNKAATNQRCSEIHILESVPEDAGEAREYMNPIQSEFILAAYESIQNACESEKKPDTVSKCNKHIVMPCAPNREFKGILKNYCGFTHSNRNILEIEVGGQENYMGNVLNIGDKVNIQHWA